MDAITYDNLFTNIKEIYFIKALKIHNLINEHATMEMTGLIKNDNGNEFAFDIRNNTPIEVCYMQGEQKKGLFCGTISAVRIDYCDDVYAVYIEAKSNTYLLDIHKHSRSFQDISMMSHELINSILSSYTNIHVDFNIPNVTIKQFIIQYNETDYEFLKRFASMYNQGILPGIDLPETHFDIGCIDSYPNVIKLEKYSIQNDIEQYEFMKANYLSDTIQLNYISYLLTSYDVLQLGNCVIHNSNNFYISDATYEIIGSLLVNTYSIQLLAGLQQKRLYNHRIIGVSIPGTVLLPYRDQLKIHLHIDTKQDVSKAYLFPYSTISASPDGSGWYNMPEIGDEVRVYFPTKDESQSFSISSASKYVPSADSKSDRMSDPNVKYIRTQADKEVKFTTEGIFISSDTTQAKINLLKDGNVVIFAQDSINMTATNNITMTAEKNVSILAQESIMIHCEKNGSIELNEAGDTLIKGFKVKSN